MSQLKKLKVLNVKNYNQQDEQMICKTIYLRKGDSIVGLHATGYEGPEEFELHHLDGAVEVVKTDFIELEKWGNEYDKDFNIKGRGSFRVFDVTLEHAAKQFEAEGYIRFIRPESTLHV